MLLRCIYLYLFVLKCLAVPPDYYSDREDESTEDTYTYTENRRHLENTEGLKKSTVTIKSSFINSEDELENDDFFELMYVSTQKSHKKHSEKPMVVYITKTSMKVENSSEDYTKILRHKSDTDSTSKAMNVFQDYEYIYDDNYQRYLQQLREESGQKEEENSAIPFQGYETDKNFSFSHFDVKDKKVANSTDISEGARQFNNKTLKYLAEFFNLEPAAGVMNYKEKESNFNKDKIWYVPEKYPCWELPVIYGELGRRKKVSEVFLVYSSRLKNVIDVNPKELNVSKNILVPDPAKIVNKWCAVSPCYGDHTLCLFSRKTYSQICDKEYRVYKPTMTEQLALVNTVNSMRNSVARGTAEEYLHLPPAANMKQIIYDFDLEEMAEAWLRQCLPGVAPCSSLDNQYITQLECTKYADYCCVNYSNKGDPSLNCIPEYECFITPVIGCIHAWYLSAGKILTGTDVECGHTGPDTFNTVQLLWGETYKIGCAFGEKSNGDVRVVCNFSPGAPYYIETNYYCGLIAHQDTTQSYPVSDIDDITDLNFLATQGILINKVIHAEEISANQVGLAKDMAKMLRTSDLDSLNSINKGGWVRKNLYDFSNGTKGMIARMVTKYTFIEHDESRCDTDEPMYVVGSPGSLCVERGRRFDALCYDFGDPTPDYRLVAILAPIALFSLILYDLFSGVVRQTNF